MFLLVMLYIFFIPRSAPLPCFDEGQKQVIIKVLENGRVLDIR